MMKSRTGLRMLGGAAALVTSLVAGYAVSQTAPAPSRRSILSFSRGNGKRDAGQPQARKNLEWGQRSVG